LGERGPEYECKTGERNGWEGLRGGPARDSRTGIKEKLREKIEAWEWERGGGEEGARGNRAKCGGEKVKSEERRRERGGDG